ncbi:MAG TPA: hypothetical protein VFE58_16300 [Tepidisphaeraceae bacterium]|jgi:hypothetical protein|nr:hypothetical protein [Tepidisphaeraceae bacterium]
MKTIQLACIAVVCVGTMALIGRGQADSSAQSNAPMGAAAVVVMNQPTVQTKIETLLATRGAVVVRGYSDAGAVQNEDSGGFSVTAVEVGSVGGPNSGQREFGLAIGIKQAGRSGISILTYVDYDELDALSSSIDYLSRMDSTATQLTGYEGRYRSKSDLQVANFADGNGTRMILLRGTQVVPETGQVLFASVYFPIARLPDIKQLLATGRQMVDKARSSHHD